MADRHDFFLHYEPCGCVLEVDTGWYLRICRDCQTAALDVPPEQLQAEIEACFVRPGRRVERVALGEKGRRVLG